MSKKPNINDIVDGLKTGADLLRLSERAADELRSTADLVYAYHVQARKLRNARPAMQPWHRWRRNRLAEKIRARLGLPAGAPIPSPE